MRKQYEAAERKAKAQYKAGLSTAGERNSEGGKKRKQPDSATASGATVNINLSFSPSGAAVAGRGSQFETSVQEQQEASPPKKAKKVGANAPKSRAVAEAKRDSALSPAKGAAKGSAIQDGFGAKGHAVKKNNPSATTKSPVLKKAQTARKEPSVKREPAVKRESAIKKEPTVKKEQVIKKEPAVKK